MEPMLAVIVNYLFLAYMLMLMVRIFGSWFPEFRDSTFMRFIGFYTDPYLNLFRKIIPPLGMIDISPIAAFFVLQFVKSFVVGILV